VRVFLPVAERSAAGRGELETKSVPGGHEAVLMVEDEEAVREVGARFLTQLGYVVHQAGDVESALHVLATHPETRLVFTDIVLPGSRGGIELAAEVARLRPDIALLFTSGYASGAVDGLVNLPGRLIDKPYQRNTLGLAVRAALDGKR
jgi:DNA-binding NtrC family response regulator